MEQDRDRVHWDPGAGSIEVTTGGRSIQIAGLADEVVFEAETDDGDTTRAFWLTPEQAAVMIKMVRYITTRVKITPESKETLEQVLPGLEGVWPGAIAE